MAFDESMVKTAQQQSLLDMLLRIMPELRDKLTVPGRANAKAANVLYTIWSKEANQIAANKFRRPSGVTKGDVHLMETEGLVSSAGDSMTITKKGGEVLKQMILGDNRSVFEDDGTPVDYLKALANTKPSRSRRTKVASQLSLGDNWYERCKYGTN